MLRIALTGSIATGVWVLLLMPGTLCVRAETVDTNPLNRQPEVREAFQLFYNMDYDEALPRFEKIQREHPNDPMATAYLLDAVEFRELNRLDLLDTTFYANDGFLTGKHTVVEDPKVRDRIRALGDQAVNQANAVLKTNSNDVNALFARGWVRSLEATMGDSGTGLCGKPEAGAGSAERLRQSAAAGSELCGRGAGDGRV